MAEIRFRTFSVFIASTAISSERDLLKHISNSILMTKTWYERLDRIKLNPNLNNI